MQEINLAIVGCGGMGTRHLYGMKEYAAVVGSGLDDHSPVRLAAVEARVGAEDPADWGWPRELNVEIGLAEK